MLIDPALVAPGTTVSAQQGGVTVRATPPDATGRFVLYPVPAGNYDLVVTAAGRVSAVMTGVPVVTTAFTTLGSETVRLSPPQAAAAFPVGGRFTVNGSSVDTGGTVRVTQALTSGPTIEVASVGGMVQSFQVQLDPQRMQLYRVTVSDVTDAIRQANNEAGGSVIEQAGAELFLFSSDYPHPEGGRDPLSRFADSLSGVDEHARERFYSGNFADMMALSTK